MVASTRVGLQARGAPPKTLKRRRRVEAAVPPSGPVVAIVQARLGSTRLPGKVLLDVAGRPMLARVLERLARARGLDRVVVATTDLARDGPLVDWCRAEGWAVHRGSEQDVLARYQAAAAAEGAGTVVRVTSDCPLVDPAVVDAVVAALQREGADYASNVQEPRTFPRGLDAEAFTAAALARADREDRDPARREHVTPYLRLHPGLFRVAAVRAPEDHADLRWTVDTPEDLELVRTVYRHFGHDRFTWRDVLDAFARHPEWRAINAHVRQKGSP